MCGNGIRCVGKYLYDSGRVKKKILKVDTLSGIKTLELAVRNDKVYEVTVDMGKAEFLPDQVPVCLDGEEVVDRAVEIGGKTERITCVSMGNPHCVVFRDDLENMDIAKEGKAFEFNPLFPERVNTEFVRILDNHTVQMRVWERGSGETMACGTGACASAVAAVKNGYCEKGEEITVKLLGGDLRIRYTDETVFMTGKAETVFSGEVEI